MIGLIQRAASVVLLGAMVAVPVDLSAQGLPLHPDRKTTFTATKGSWISLDVSPDGRTIVFDLLGDLYTLPIDGGTATRLTRGLAFDAQPRFSPDGKRIVFVSDRSGADNLWWLTLDGKDPVQLTKGETYIYSSPVWTPDGRYVVAGRATERLGGPAKLWMYNVDGGAGAAVVSEPAALKATGPAVSPDGRYLWYASRLGDWEYDAIFPMYQLSAYDRQTGTTARMSARYGSAFRPGLSPDGRSLVYGTRYETETGLRLRDLATGEERWLAYPVQRDDQEASRGTLDLLPGYGFTPDSKSLIASYGGEIWRVPLDGGAARKIPFTAEVTLDLGPEVRFDHRIPDADTFAARQIRDLAPSPDGKRLAFVALDRVYVVDLPNGTPRRLTNQQLGEFAPTWSPDGRAIAFVSWSEAAGGGHIYRANADGSGRPERLTASAALYMQPAWAPDGTRIVAIRAAARDLREAYDGFYGYGLGAQFVWIPAQQPGKLVVIGPAANRGYPHFTRDSTRIYAYGPADGLVSFRWDGTDVKSLIKVEGPAAPHRPGGPTAQMVKMAPEGDQALALVGTDIYLVTVPRLGGTAPTIVTDSVSAAFPIRKLTDIGGQFPTWEANGAAVHWAIGNTHVLYDLSRARAVGDSLRAIQPIRGGDTTAANRDGVERPRGYLPVERRIVVSIPRDVPRGDVVLRGARVITMRGAEVIDNADLVIHDNRIAAVGPRGTTAIPSRARVIDLSGKTIVPGFVDIHYHPQQLVPNIHTEQPWQYLAQLAYGVTTTRDPQSSTTDVFSYEDQVDAGHLIGPRILTTGPSIDYQKFRDYADVRNAVKRYAQYYGVQTLKMYLTGNRRTRQWIVMAAKELGVMPTTEGGLDFKLNLTHAMDGYSGLEHALPVTPLYGDVLELFRGSGITYTPTLIVSYGGPFSENYWFTNTEVHDNPKLRHFTPEIELDARTRRRGGRTIASGGGPGGWFRADEYVFRKHAAFAKALVEAGGRVGIGSHGQLQGLGYHWELWMMGSGGMSNHDVLRTATILSAEGIGLGRDLGSLEVGKMADLVVLDRNPLDDIKHTEAIRLVMKNGRLYEANTLNEIYPRSKVLPSFSWQDDAPRANAGIR